MSETLTECNEVLKNVASVLKATIAKEDPMPTKINSLRYIIREVIKPYNKLNYKVSEQSIIRIIEDGHKDGREGAKIKCDLWGLEPNKYPGSVRVILEKVMEWWSNNPNISTIVFIPHYGRGKCSLGTKFDEDIREVIEGIFATRIHAYISLKGDKAVHLFRNVLDIWSITNDFNLMWSTNLKRNGANSRGVTS